MVSPPLVPTHQAPDGLCARTHAATDELWAIAEAMHAFGQPVLVSPLGVVSSDPEMLIKEFDWMRRLSAEFSIPVLMILNQIPSNIDLYREILICFLKPAPKVRL